MRISFREEETNAEGCKSKKSPEKAENKRRPVQQQALDARNAGGMEWASGGRYDKGRQSSR
jgi:hypothetical protein